MAPEIPWPDGKRFAFTVFDDPDAQTLETGLSVYSFLSDLGFRTTKAVWPIRGGGVPSDHGSTCAEPDYRCWAQRLQADGFEIAFHNATAHTSPREETLRGLEAFAEYFGAYPSSMANHYANAEQIYSGDFRVSGAHRTVYNILTRWENKRVSFGHQPGHRLFWGDLLRKHIKYLRGFAFADTNTLRACPYMPYHDPDRPYANHWFACSEGSDVKNFNSTLSETRQDQLEEAGGACVMYTHFGHGFDSGGELDSRFVELMERLSKKNGWFVPVSTLLDYIRHHRGVCTITRKQRRKLERRWLMHKVRYGRA